MADFRERSRFFGRFSPGVCEPGVSWLMRALLFAILVLCAISEVQAAPDRDIGSGAAAVRVCDHFCITLHGYEYGLVEFSRQPPSGPRQFETHFHWRDNFFSLPISAPVALALVGLPMVMFSTVLFYIFRRARRLECELQAAS